MVYFDEEHSKLSMTKVMKAFDQKYDIESYREEFELES